jgi:hypothetical protein
MGREGAAGDRVAAMNTASPGLTAATEADAPAIAALVNIAFRGSGSDAGWMTVVNVRDTLIAWYVRRGYTLTGETEPFPYGDIRFGVPRRDDLHFVILRKRLVD